MAKQNYGRRAGDLFEDNPAPVKGWVIAHCDGGSRGNPGPSGFGVLVEDEQGKVIAELSEFLGKRTNNYAEYAALLAALNFAVEQGHPRLRVIADSELMVKQIKGQYRVNSPELKPLHELARHRIALLEGFEIQHVLREKNRRADELANVAMDRGMSGRGAGGVTGRAASESFPVAASASRAAGPIPISRPGIATTASGPGALQEPPDGEAQAVRGFVKGGVVHLLDGAQLPDGIFVKITPDE